MYEALKAALNATGIPFKEYGWKNAPPPSSGSYGVIALDSQASALWADGRMEQQALEGTIDLFCFSLSRTDMQTVQGVLNAQGVSWTLNSIQFEREKKLIHYEWVFEVS